MKIWIFTGKHNSLCLFRYRQVIIIWSLGCLSWLFNNVKEWIWGKYTEVHWLSQVRRKQNSDRIMNILCMLDRPMQGNPDSGILGIGFRNPTNDWNPESKFHWQRIRNTVSALESMAWNPESKIVLGCVPLGWSRSGSLVIRDHLDHIL